MEDGDRLISLEDVRRLAGVDVHPDTVVSVYLNVDGREYPRRGDYETHLEHLLRVARSRGASEADVAPIRDHVRALVDRNHTKALAMFSCASHDFWEVLPLPRPVPHRVSVGHSPAIRPLEMLLDDYKRFLVVLVDRSRARIFRLSLGVIEESTEWDDDVMGQHDQGGWSQSRFARHVDEEAHKHLKVAADHAFHMFEAQPFDHVVLGGPDEMVAEFEKVLHSYLSERVAGRISVSLADPVETIREAALAEESRIENEEQSALVDKLREAVGRQNGGVGGLGAVLDMIGQRRAEVLLVSRGYETPGWRCLQCSLLAAVGPACRLCGQAMERVEDVVEEAIEEAVAQSASVEMVSDNPDLDVLGRIGAILRY